MSGAIHVGRETTTRAFGAIWRFSRWEHEAWISLADIAKKHLPDPIEVMLKHIDKVALKDAEVIRGLRMADMKSMAEHMEKCTKDRNYKEPVPPSMEAAYTPIADQLVRIAMDKACTYLEFNSPSMNNWIAGPVGGPFLFELLLKENHKDISSNDAYCLIVQITKEMGAKEVVRIREVAQGMAEDKLPNAEAPAA